MMAPEWLLVESLFRRRSRERLLDPGSWAVQLGFRRPLEAFFRGRRGEPFPRALAHLDLLAWRLLLLDSWYRSLEALRLHATL
jgi:hypothetical protein